MTSMTFTLADIRQRLPCESGWKRLLRRLGGSSIPLNTRLSLGDVAISNGLEDALWCVRCLDFADPAVRRAVMSIFFPSLQLVALHAPDPRVQACMRAIQSWLEGNDDEEFHPLIKEMVSAIKEFYDEEYNNRHFTSPKVTSACSVLASVRFAHNSLYVEEVLIASKEICHTYWCIAYNKGGKDDAKKARAAQLRNEKSLRDKLIAIFPPLLLTSKPARRIRFSDQSKSVTQ